jgi:prolyl oligopeptidase
VSLAPNESLTRGAALTPNALGGAIDAAQGCPGKTKGIATVMRYPPAERRPVVDDLHGRPVADPYRWLEEPGSAATAAWVAAQDELWLRHAGALPGRARLRSRVAELSGPGLITAPMWRGTRRFFLRQTSLQEHPVLHCAEPDGVENALVDPMRLDPSGHTTLDHWQPDLEGRLLACQLSRHGDERSELVVLDVATRRQVDGPIDRCRSSPVAWLPGGAGFYYVRAAEPGAAARRVYLHRLGTPADADASVLGEGRDPATSYGLEISADSRWLIVSASKAAANDLWIAALATGDPRNPDLRTIQQGEAAHTVATVGRDGRLYLATDRDAPRGRLCVADPAAPRPESWRDLVRAGPDEVLADFAVLDGPELEQPLLLVSMDRHAISAVGVHDLATGPWLRDVPLPGLGSVGSLSVRPEGGHEAWFAYTDSITPGAVHRYDARTGETTPWAVPPGSVELPDVEAREIVYPSADGTPVRMVVLAQPDPDCGPRPAILYGYGGFGIPLTPTYSSYVLAWVEAGGVFATANVRGGGEEGEQWHRAGMLDRKQNSIADFLAAAQRLVTAGWTSSDQLGICGESNGGLLVGAALTQRPELFAAAVCSAPLLDMVRYERSGLGPTWTGEYGSADDPEQLDWLLRYSPYHHVRPGGEYPATLFTVFDGDTRVDPLHARKMCAALQWAVSAPAPRPLRGGRRDRPILLRREADVGHGDRATSRAVGLAGDLLAFLAAHTGLTLGATHDVELRAGSVR